MKLLVSAIIALLLSSVASVAWAEGSLFSGFELFPGIKLDGITIGATFSGWTQTPGPEQWVPFTSSTGGFVSGSVNYAGSPGFGHSVNIIGGKWAWLEADDHTIHSGPVLSVLNGVSSAVTWPANAQTDLGCGPGIATFYANVGDGLSHTIGAISGCLNDQLTFPPKIWGIVNLPSAP